MISQKLILNLTVMPVWNGQAPCTRDIVEMFIGDDLFNLFVTETNLYYYQQNNDNDNESTKNKAWIYTNVAEMKKILGRVIIMGIVKKARERRLLVYPPKITYTYFREHNAKKQR